MLWLIWRGLLRNRLSTSTHTAKVGLRNNLRLLKRRLGCITPYPLAFKSFHVDSRVPGWPCHCDLILTSKSAIFDPPCTREKDGRGQSGPNSCFPIDIVFIWGVQEFPRWFQGPWVTLPLWPDFDLKISHFWPPVPTGEGWQGWKRHLTMFSYWYKCDLRH